MVIAMSREDDEVHHVPLQYEDQRDHQTFQDEQELAPE